MKTKFNGILTLLLAFMVQLTFAQERTISGVVSDDLGPVSDITVKVRGTDRGSVTDFDGNYSIKAKTGDVIDFTHISYNSIEKIVGTSNKIDVLMGSSGVGLDEVVVTGVAQGTSTKKLGFKVDKVNLEGVSNVTTFDVASALSGKIAGAKIVKGNGNPLRNSAIILRGASSIEGDTTPLIIIDGMITNGNLNDINMEDVKSIEVVKGAAASSLYGSLAGNGVIHIITKKGTSSDPRVTIKSEHGISVVSGDFPLATKHNREINPDGTINYSVQDADGLFNNEFDQPIINNIDKFIKPQPYTQTSVSLSQRIDKINYYLSAQHSNVNGIIEGINPYIKQNFRLNLEADVTAKFKIKTNVAYIKTKGQEVQGGGQGDNLFFNFFTADPTIDLSVLNADGDYIPFYSGNGWLNEYQNPLYIASHQKNDKFENRLMGGIGMSFQLNKNLSLEGNLSLDKNNFKYTNFFHKGYVSGSQASPNIDNGFIFIRNSITNRVNSSVQLNYNKKWDNYGFRSSIKYLHEDESYDREDGSGSNFPTAGVDNLSQATENIKIRSYKSLSKSQNYFLTADFDWKDKIIIGGVIRSDRSSLFGENERDQIFYRGSLAYRLGEDLETKWIDELKLRTSYGTAGLRPTYGAIYQIFEIDPTSNLISYAQASNPNLKSPTISELELGLDLNFLKKYKFSVSYAKSNTEGAILLVPQEGFQGGSSQYRNAGNTEYKSLELSLNGTPYSKNDFTWGLGITWNTVDNTYGKLDVQPYNRTIRGDLFDSAPAVSVFRVQEGLPFGAMFGNSLASSLDQLTVVNGLVINHGLNLPLTDFSVNEYGHVIVTANQGVNDGALDTGEQAIQIWNEETGAAATKLIGDTTPDFNMGISNTFTYKNLSLYSLLDIQKGGDIYNYTKQFLYFNDRHADLQGFGEAGQPSAYSSASSSIYNAGQPIDYFVEDASYIKLREVSLSYLLDSKILGDKFPVENVKLSFSGRNLLTITDYSGWDPEVAVKGSPIFKLDEFSYPSFKTYAASIQITF